MKYVRILKDTFIHGTLAVAGTEYEVDDRTAILLGSKAIEIDVPGGKEKDVVDGPMETMQVIRQQEVVVRPVNKCEIKEEMPSVEPEGTEETKVKPEQVKRGKGGKKK